MLHPARCATPHHWRLKRRWPFRGSLRTGSISRPFPDKQQVLPPTIHLHFKQLVLFVRKSNRQRLATVRPGYVLLDAYFPPACLPATSVLRRIQFPQQRPLKHDHFCLRHFENELGGAAHFHGVPCFDVMPRCRQSKSWLSAHWVGVMLVGTLPSTMLIVESKKTGEKEDGWTGLAALAHPAPVQVQRDGCR